MAISANDTIRIGIIGCGGIANGKHMPSLKKIDTVEMVAFCDIVRERAEKAAKEYGTPDARVYTDYKELLKEDDIDVVHVLTPNKQHSFITVDALEAGKPIICAMREGDFTTTGHYIVLRGVKDGEFQVNDPNSVVNSEKLWSYEQIEGQIRNLWVMEKA